LILRLPPYKKQLGPSVPTQTIPDPSPARLSTSGRLRLRLSTDGYAIEVPSANYETLCQVHILPRPGAYKLRDLRTSHVDQWLKELSPQLTKRTPSLLVSLLDRSVQRAMAKDLVGRDVVAVATVPAGRPGQPSKSLTIEQAQAILDNAASRPFYACIVVSLPTGARTEEMRALT
jgi:hypothetical protein